MHQSTAFLFTIQSRAGGRDKTCMHYLTAAEGCAPWQSCVNLRTDRTEIQKLLAGKKKFSSMHFICVFSLLPEIQLQKTWQLKLGISPPTSTGTTAPACSRPKQEHCMRSIYHIMLNSAIAATEREKEHCACASFEQATALPALMARVAHSRFVSTLGRGHLYSLETRHLF